MIKAGVNVLRLNIILICKDSVTEILHLKMLKIYSLKLQHYHLHTLLLHLG